MIELTGDRDIDELVKEFDLETADAYFARARRLRSESLARFQKSKTAAGSGRPNRSGS